MCKGRWQQCRSKCQDMLAVWSGWQMWEKGCQDMGMHGGGEVQMCLARGVTIWVDYHHPSLLSCSVTIVNSWPPPSSSYNSPELSPQIVRLQQFDNNHLQLAPLIYTRSLHSNPLWHFPCLATWPLGWVCITCIDVYASMVSWLVIFLPCTSKVQHLKIISHHLQDFKTPLGLTFWYLHLCDPITSRSTCDSTTNNSFPSLHLHVNTIWWWGGM